MAKIKKTFLIGIMTLFTVALCVPFAACGNDSADVERNEKTAAGDEEIEPRGLYTDLQFGLNGENGQVTASVKNKFTLFSATVTVNIELFRSDTYQEDYKNMTLAASNYVYDLDQGETITATASTDGKQGYWKARAQYKVDNNDWQENLSETVFLNENGIKTTVSAPVTENKEYYVSDFLQAETKSWRVSLFPYVIGTEYEDGIYHFIFRDKSFAFLESEDEFNCVKNIFGEIKLEPFDMPNMGEERAKFLRAFTSGRVELSSEFSDGSLVFINVISTGESYLDRNLSVHYFEEHGPKTGKYFLAKISEEAIDSLVKLVTDKLSED